MLYFAKGIRVRGSNIVWVNALFNCMIVFSVIVASLLTGFHLKGASFQGDGEVVFISLPGKGCRPHDHSKCEAALSNKEDLPYCEQSGLPSNEKKLPCMSLSSSYANSVASGFQQGALIPSATGMVTYKLPQDLTGSDPPAVLEELVNASWFYSAEVERYWVEIVHHGRYLDSKDISGPSLQGFYVDSSNNRFHIQDIGSLVEQHSGVSRAEGGRATPTMLETASVDRSGLIVSAGGKLIRGHRKNRFESRLWKESSDHIHLRPRASNQKSEFLKWDTSSIFSNGDMNKMQLHTLLRLANISLESPTSRWSTWRSNMTNRWCGVDLHVSIVYSNMEKWLGFKVTPWRMNELHYEYAVSGSAKKHCRGHLPSAIQGLTNKAGTHRSFRKLSGINIHINVSGTINCWDWWTALMTVTFILTGFKIYRAVLEIVLSRYTTWFDEFKFQTVDCGGQDASQDSGPSDPNNGHA